MSGGQSETGKGRQNGEKILSPAQASGHAGYNITFGYERKCKTIAQWQDYGFLTPHLDGCC